MNKFVQAAATSQSLSLAGMEEASRLGRRTADLDELFLALLLNGDAAGQALRGIGITLETARQAVGDQHAAQLAHLGITAPDPEPGRIVFHEVTASFAWSERVLDIFKRSGSRGMSGSSSDVLRTLLAEPSGTVEQLIARLGTSSEEILSRLDEFERLPAVEHRRPHRDERSTRVELFIPAPAETVWELLADPSRMPEWDPSTASVDASEGPASVGDTWIARAPLERPDGKPIRVKQEFRRRRIELITAEEPTRIAWLIDYPDARRGVPRRATIELSPAVGGTQLTASLAWQRLRGWRRVLTTPLGPFQRFLTWLGLWQVGSQISRVFR